MRIYILIILMMLVTYIPRAIPSLVVDKLKFPPKFEKFLGLIPYTAMAALIFPGVLGVDPGRWYIGVVGGAVAVILSMIRKMPVALTVIASVAAVMLMYALI